MKNLSTFNKIERRGVLTRNKNNHSLIFLSEESEDQNYFQLLSEFCCFIVLIVSVSVIIYGLKHVNDTFGNGDKDEEDGTQTRRTSRVSYSQVLTQSRFNFLVPLISVFM